MRNLGIFVFALVLLGVAMAGPAAMADGPGNWIQNVGRGKCIQPDGGSLEEGAPIIQTTCNDSAIQRWEFLADSDFTTYQVRNVVSGRCLDVAGGANNHTPIQQWTCNWISNEKWDLGPYYVQLRSRVSGTSSHCLDVPGATSEDVWLQLYRCNTTDAQIWTIGPIILQ